MIVTNRIDKRTTEDTRDRASSITTKRQDASQSAFEDYAYRTVAYQSIFSGDTGARSGKTGSGATESELFDYVVTLDADTT